MERITDTLSLIVYVANKSPHAVFVIPGGLVLERLFCVKSLTNEAKMKEFREYPAANGWLFFDSPNEWATQKVSRWRSLKVRCMGCGRPMGRHK